SKLAREITCLAPQASAVRADERGEQAQQRPPALHVLAVLVNGGRVRPRGVLECLARLVQNVAGRAGERLADPEIRTYAGFAGHGKVDPPPRANRAIRARLGKQAALPNRCADCYISGAREAFPQRPCRGVEQAFSSSG